MFLLFATLCLFRAPAVVNRLQHSIRRVDK